MEQSIFQTKLARLRDLLIAKGLDAVKLTLQKNVSWLLGGRSHVNTASEPACCQFLITREQCALVINNIEARRVMEEEASDPAMKRLVTTLIWPWYEPPKREQLTQEFLQGLTAVKPDSELENSLLQLRSIMHKDQFEEWRILGERTADAIEQAAFQLSQGQSEYQIAGILAQNCWEREIEPIVNLIAVDERVYTRRHPLPTGRRLSKYAMLVVCARRNGLVASATRLVHFGAVPAELRSKHEAVAAIDAGLIHATRSGANLSKMFALMTNLYNEAGFVEEYKDHHQGGLTGYNSREKIATPRDSFVISPGQIFAWNPSIAGVKSEDTVIVTDEKPKLLTVSSAKAFPTIQVKVGGTIWDRPDILVRS